MSVTRVGAFEVEKVIELERPFVPAREFFPGLTEEMLADCRAALPAGQFGEAGELVLSFHAFVLRTSRHTILVDTCCGNDKDRPSRPMLSRLRNDFVGALRRAGVEPEAVDYVLCTHLHWDHVGWNTQLVDGQWVPTFPNARHVMARKEYEYWDAAHRRGEAGTHGIAFEDSVLPLMRAEQAMLVDDDFELEPGIRLEPCPGHTPGNVVINLDSQGQRGSFTGDVLHHRMQLRLPQIATAPDSDPAAAAASRRALLERHAGAGTLFFPAHFIAPTTGRIEPDGDAFRYAT